MTTFEQLRSTAEPAFHDPFLREAAKRLMANREQSRTAGMNTMEPFVSEDLKSSLADLFRCWRDFHPQTREWYELMQIGAPLTSLSAVTTMEQVRAEVSREMGVCRESPTDADVHRIFHVRVQSEADMWVVPLGRCSFAIDGWLHRPNVHSVNFSRESVGHLWWKCTRHTGMLNIRFVDRQQAKRMVTSLGLERHTHIIMDAISEVHTQ